MVTHRGFVKKMREEWVHLREILVVEKLKKLKVHKEYGIKKSSETLIGI